MNINDGVIDTLANDDFVCYSCTDDLLYAGTDKLENDNSTSLNLDNTQNTPEKLSQTGKIHVTNDTYILNTETDPKIVTIDSELRSKQVINSEQNNKEYTSIESSSTKTKPKKMAKKLK